MTALAPDLDAVTLASIGVRPTPLARRALADTRRARLHAWAVNLNITAAQQGRPLIALVA